MTNASASNVRNKNARTMATITDSIVSRTAADEGRWRALGSPAAGWPDRCGLVDAGLPGGDDAFRKDDLRLLMEIEGA